MPNQVVLRRPWRKRGQNWLPSTSLIVGEATGAGGVLMGGAATVAFVHGPQVASDVTVEWDLDNDGDFSEAVEDITSYVTAAETFTGRDWPSLLTGKAGPGKLRASLNNADNRFNYFNASSPLATAPFSLRTGRKVRVRVSEAGNPDPTPIARDRFRRDMGALGSEEYGHAYSEPLAADFTVFATRAVASSEGSAHMALIDTGGTDYYVQAKAAVVGDTTPTNRAGVVYRYVDTANYSLCVIDATDSSLQLIDVTAGVEELAAAYTVEVYSGVTIGVHVDGNTATGYLEGVPLISAPAPNESAEFAGFYALWATGDSRPEMDEFYAWTGLPVPTEGILWTGDITEAGSSVAPGPERVAAIAGEGWLSKLSAQEITPPASLSGRPTGFLAGNALAKALQLHPPGVIDKGDVTTGTFAMPERSALAVARDVEEVEFGFLYETQEGHLSFRDRSHRDGSVSQVTFTDDPAGQFHYHSIEPYDWRTEVFNRVLAGVSPWTEGEDTVLFTDPGPYSLTSGQSQPLTANYDGTVVRYTGHTRDVTGPGGDPAGITITPRTGHDAFADVVLPAGIDAGDLILILFAMWPDGGSSTAGFLGTPAGYTPLQTGSVDRVVARVADGTEDGASVTFQCVDEVTWAAQVFIITDWIGDLSGVTAVPGVFGSGSQPNPPAITMPWGPLPTLVIPYATWPYDRDVSSIPTNYTDEEFTESLDGGVLNIDVGLVSAQRIVTAMNSTDPGVFTLNSSVNQWRARTIIVQGPVTTIPVTSDVPSGSDPTFTIGYDVGLGGTVQVSSNIEVTGIPLIQGDQTFAQVDDYTSQDDHNAIRTYQAAASLFATPAQAEEYANLVLSTYADDRPILSMSFYAVKSGAYRAQALRRRVGDRITVIATGNAGLGVDQDFYIESISHKFSHGIRLWEVTWELSPA